MNDLFFSAKINDAAKKLGTTAVFVKDEALALQQLKLNPAVVIFDLNCTSVDPLELLRVLKQNPETASIGTVGFVSHVQTGLKQKAQAAGCDTVLARSVFAQNLPEILEQYVTQQPACEGD